MSSKRILIVGGVAGGASCAARLRRMDEQAEIIIFERGGDVSFVVDELKAVFDPRGGQWMEGHYVPSLLAAIGDVIEKHLIAIGFMAARDGELAGDERKAVAIAAEGAPARHCPRCGSPSFVKLEGCDSCLSCSYSKCG